MIPRCRHQPAPPMTKDQNFVPLHLRDDLDRLNDEHMQHIFNFLDLGKFDRAEFERERAYTRFKIDHHRRMVERDQAARVLQASEGNRDKYDH
jgi:hypothetical protein